MISSDTFQLISKRWLISATARLLIVFAAVGASQALAQDGPATILVQTTDGHAISGELAALNSQLLELVDKGESQTIGFDQIESVNFINTDQGEKSSPLQCRLADGSSLNAQSISISESQAQLQLSSGQQIIVAKKSLKSLLLFDAADDPDRLRQWDDFLPSFTAASDAIVAKKNESLQAIEGIVGDVGDQGYEFQMGGREVTVKSEKLTGVVFYRADREFPESVCQILLNDDSTIAAAQIELAEGNFNVATGTGDRIVLSTELVASLNLSAGRAIYLSDLLPTTNDWKPLVASQTNLDSLAKLNLSIANESFTGQPLSLKSVPTDGLNFLATTQTYEKGFAIGGGGRLAFNLNGQFKRLTALVGFDPEMEALPGNIEMAIQVDNKSVLSAVLKNRQLLEPLPIDLDLSNAKRLVIRVNYNDGRSVGDRIHMVDARLWR